MKNLLNFFFSFDKLFKEKLVVPFFWLALIVFGLGFFAEALDSIRLDPLAMVVEFVNFFASVLLALVTIRIVAELFVTIFRINDNLSPDRGRSELADIDPLAEARRAAEAAAARTREMTQMATDKTRKTIDDGRDRVEARTDIVRAKPAPSKPSSAKPSSAKSASAAASPTLADTSPASTSAMGKGAKPSTDDAPTPVKALEPSAVDAAKVVKRGRGRPKGSRNKPKADAASSGKSAAKSTAKSTATSNESADAPVKRGRGRPKGSKNKSTATAAKAQSAKAASAKSKAAPILDPATGEPVKRGRGRPKGSRNKPKVLGPDGTPVKAKPGPKPGTKMLRDADGNLLKKDGTPRKKPGPKPKSDDAS